MIGAHIDVTESYTDGTALKLQPVIGCWITVQTQLEIPTNVDHTIKAGFRLVGSLQQSKVWDNMI